MAPTARGYIGIGPHLITRQNLDERGNEAATLCFQDKLVDIRVCLFFIAIHGSSNIKKMVPIQIYA